MAIDPYNGEESLIIQFLTECFENGSSYGSLNSARSAISLISLKNISDSKIINRFLKGIYRLRPSKPKYDKTWDIGPVLKEISMWYPLENLDLRKLTNKLVILLALGTAQRVQTLALIKLSNIIEVNNGYEIEITDLIKTSRPGSYQPLLKLPEFLEKPELCIAKTLRQYINVTSNIRTTSENLLVTLKKPHKAASTGTISRWLKESLVLCGIGREYSAHSTRHAVTSAAFKKGINLNIIKRAAGWSKDSKTFANYYHRPIDLDETVFATSVIQDY